MNTENKWVTAITKLNELTQEGTLKWTRSTDTEKITWGTDDTVDVCYLTEYVGRRLRLYELKFQRWISEEVPVWDNKVVLEFIDEDAKKVWEFPSARATWDLLKSVTYSCVDAEEFLFNLLRDEPKKKGGESPPSV